MKCEACGGDGLIEVGAYRGDESDTATRECRLCGGVKVEVLQHSPELGELLDRAIAYKDERRKLREIHPASKAVEALKQLGQAAAKAGAITAHQLTPKSTHGSWATSGNVTRIDYKSPQDTAREFATQLNAENERRQREAENGTNSVMNDFLREDRRRQ